MDGQNTHAIFNKGPVVVFRWRNEAGWPVEYVSENVREVLGYDAEAFRTQALSYGDILLPDDAPRVASEVQTASAQGLGSFEHEPYRVRHGDGSARWLHDFTHVIRDADGRATHFVGYIFDITRRMHAEAAARELERQLLHAQKLESLGLLAGGVAHDFNNVLTGMLGQLGLARRLVHDEAAPILPYLDRLERLAQHAAGLTNQLLAYSGKGSFVVEPIDLNALLVDMASMIKVVAGRPEAIVQVLDADLPLVVADRTQLQQVIINLLSNASDALGEAPGRITVSTHATTLEATAPARNGDAAMKPGSFVELRVADTGCGMSDETRARVFEPFFTTKPTGRGLGLPAICGIVRSLGGRISVTSKLGQGTAFTVLLPAAATAPAQLAPTTSGHVGVTASTPRATNAPTSTAGTVLIVDDNAALRATAAELLQQMGFATLEAANGAEALALYDRDAARIALVLLDLTMPGLSGGEVMAALHQRRAQLPIILSSGFSEQEAISRTARAVGSPHDATPSHVRFLKKPYRLADFEQLVRQAVSH